MDWYEAVAFTRWLSHELGYEVRLPTEQEWEKAARGTDGREYPWGDGYRSGFANIDEKENKDGPWYLEQTTAVGIYLHDESPFGVKDMAGNVWEWALNKYEHPDYTTPDTSGDSRVLRGGAWLGRPDDARAVDRGRSHPGYRFDGGGFRVLCVSPFSEH